MDTQRVIVLPHLEFLTWKLEEYSFIEIYWLNKNYKQWKNGQSVIDNVITNTSLISLENINEVQANKSGVNNEINTSKSTDHKSTTNR